MNSIDESLLPAYLKRAIDEKQLSRYLLDVQAMAAKGNTEAMIALSYAYFSGKHGLYRDYGLAKKWIDEIDPIRDKYGYVPHTLGLMYYKGLGVEMDRNRAYKYFRRGTLQGNPRSKVMVAAMQSVGDGVSRKPISAKRLFSQCTKNRIFNLPTRVYLFFRSIW